MVTTQTDQAVKTDHCQPPTTIILIQIIIITSLTTYTYNLHYKLRLRHTTNFIYNTEIIRYIIFN